MGDYKFKTKDEVWHLGHEGYELFTDRPGYVSEGGKFFSSHDISTIRNIICDEVYYWNSDDKKYELLKVKYDNSSAEERFKELMLMASDPSKYFPTEQELVRHIRMEMREWLLIYSKFDKPLYLGKEGEPWNDISVVTDGDFELESYHTEIPDSVESALKKGGLIR